MGVICLASLKGGVGKTSVSVNVAHAFASQGCEALLIDLDPNRHATRIFRRDLGLNAGFDQSPLAKLFFQRDLESSERSDGQGPSEKLLDLAVNKSIPLLRSVREHFAILPAGPELRHFLWGRGAQMFRDLFPVLIDELRMHFDYIVIDTPPDYNVLSRNAIAVSDLAVVPVDSSAMSIYCLEDLVAHSAHIKGPTWAILRSMVNRQASRIKRLSDARIEDLLGSTSGNSEGTSEAVVSDSEQSPLYLLNAMVYRTEQQNRLTFLGKTSFDMRSTDQLAQQYALVSKEFDELISLSRRGELALGNDASADFLPSLSA